MSLTDTTSLTDALLIILCIQGLTMHFMVGILIGMLRGRR